LAKINKFIGNISLKTSHAIDLINIGLISAIPSNHVIKATIRKIVFFANTKACGIQRAFYVLLEDNNNEN